MNGRVRRSIITNIKGFELYWHKFPTVDEEKSFLREYLASNEGKDSKEISEEQVHLLWVEVEKFTLVRNNSNLY